MAAYDGEILVSMGEGVNTAAIDRWRADEKPMDDYEKCTKRKRPEGRLNS